MSKSYLKYLFKNNKNLFIAITVIYTLFYMCGLFIDNFDIDSYVLGLAIVSVVMYLSSFILVPIIHHFIHNKKAIDTYFALPVDRKKMLETSLIFTDFLMLAPYIVLAIFTGVISNSYGIILHLNYYVFFIIAMTIVVIVQTCFNTSMFTLANSTFDGIVMIIAYMVMPACIYFIINAFQSSYVAGVVPIDVMSLLDYISLPISCLDTLPILMDYAISKTVPMFSWLDISRIIICVVAYIVISVRVLNKHFINRNVERAETISDSFFSYPFVIRFYTFSLIFIILESTYQSMDVGTLILYIVVFICFLIANFVYRRKIAITLKDIAFFALSILLALGFSYASYKTRGFGLSYTYNKNPNNYGFSYYSMAVFDGEDNDKELTNIILKKYPDMNMYDYSVLGVISNNEITKAKDVTKVIEEIRIDAIENFYNNDVSIRKVYNNMSIVTNCDEQNFPAYFNDTERRREYCIYEHAPMLSYEQLVKLSKYFDVKINIYCDKDYYEGVNLIDITSGNKEIMH